MAYSNRANRMTSRNLDTGKSANVELQIKSSDGDYLCNSLKNYTEKASIVQDLSNHDSFITLSKFSKNPAALTVNDAKVIVVKNISTKDKIASVKLTKAKALSSCNRAANKSKFVVPKIATITIEIFVSKFFILIFFVG